MYDILNSLVGHTWITTNAPGNQTYLYVGALLLIITLVFYFLDLIIGMIFKIINLHR